MLGCAACGSIGASPLCSACERSLRSAPIRTTPGGVVVRSAVLHKGPARALVHNLKYRAVMSAADVLGGAMAEVLPYDALALVPVPRATIRRLRYGVDPAEVLARVVARHTGLPVIDALSPGLWWRRHAPQSAEERVSPPMRARRPVPDHAVLVDDVVRTGLTIDAAAAALGKTALSALAATTPPSIQ